MTTLQSEDIASKLLHSSDARIAEAAKRVFSSSYPATAVNPAASSPFSNVLNPPNRATSKSVVERSGKPSGFFSAGAPLHGIAQRSAVNAPRPAEVLSATVNDPQFSALSSFAESDKEGNEKKPSSTDRLQRSRERNRMHARKTRQRKKEHMQKLQNEADELKMEQIRLKQAINEKNTANILVGLFSTGDGADNGESSVACDPKVESLLKRRTEDIPDASKIPELPALVLPGYHNGKKKSPSDGSEDADGATAMMPEDGMQEDGIDYALLGKDRSSCSPAELDQIRRERNRMHAKRTRDRKRIFMEEMEVMIRQLKDENLLLKNHMNKLTTSQSSAAQSPQMISPEFGPACTTASPGQIATNPQCLSEGPQNPKTTAGLPAEEMETQRTKGDFLNQIESLLAAAGAFEKRKSLGEINAVSCAESDVTASTNHSDSNSLCEDDDNSHRVNGHHPNKKQCVHPISELPSSVPSSITTTTTKHTCL